MKDDNDRPAPLYSVCATYLNSIPTVERSLASILDQTDERFEVIVVDGGSTDGTIEAVRKMQSNHEKLVLVSQPCSRGLGRDTAFRLSRGRYLIQGADGDTIFQPTLQSVLDYYHSNEKAAGECALFIPEAFCICTRETMDKIGGWPDLQCNEDVYIGGKLMRVCPVEINRSLHDVVVKQHVKSKKGRLLLSHLKYRYVFWRDFHRYLPFANAVEVLRSCLGERMLLQTRFGTVALFLLGAVGQYSKSRFKLHGTDLLFYKRFHKEIPERNLRLVE